MELIVAVASSAVAEDEFYQVPLLDISLGLISERLQISVTYPHVHADLKDDSSNYEFSNLELGATLRIWQNDRWQIGFAPIYAFGVTRRTAEQGIGQVGDVISLPVVAEYQINGNWRINSALGYQQVEDGPDLWTYGGALAWGATERIELLAELVGAVNTNTRNDAVDARVGLDFAVTQRFHLLLSVARGLREATPAEELDHEIFVGLQYLF